MNYTANSLRKFYDDRYLTAADLTDSNGKRQEMTVKAVRFEPIKLRSQDGGDDRKTAMHAIGRDGKPTRAPIVISKRNLKIIAKAYGADTPLEGQIFTLYLADEKHFGEVFPVIKIRKPNARDAGNAALAGKVGVAAAAREPGDDS